MSLIIMARNLGKAIQEDPDYLKLEEARKANDADPELQKLVDQFNAMGAAMETEADKSDPDESAMDKLNKEMLDLYSVIMENPNMAAFNTAKEAMDEKMDEIVNILAAAVNGEDPMTYEVEKKHSHEGCGGDCSCCHGC